MVLNNHIASKFLLDDTFVIEMMSVMMPDELNKMTSDQELSDMEKSQLFALNNTVSAIDQKAFYITDTILDKVQLLKVNLKENGHYDWSVFSHLKNQKKTFIFSNNSLIRLSIDYGFICFCWIDAKPSIHNKKDLQTNFHLFNLNQETQEFSHNWIPDSYIGELEEKIYKLLCFFYLCENEEIVINPGEKYGNRKQGKFINTFSNIPVTIVNNNWNVTSIRTESFGVRGHFAIRWTGKDRQTPKMVFIEPFKKNGYIRKSIKPADI